MAKSENSTFGSPSMKIPDSQRSKVTAICEKYEINSQYSFYFDQLNNFDVVFLCDDSTSMREKLKATDKMRWDELKLMVSIMIDILSTIQPEGLDIYFLNREPLLCVRDSAEISSIFQTLPNGLTPMVPTLRQILADRKTKGSGKKLIIFIATDGVPTNEKHEPDIAALEQVLRKERDRNTFVTFLSCTDDSATIDYLEKLDKNIPNIDVVDDYATESAQIRRNRGPNFPFSKGLYMCKALFGSINPWFDLLDEKQE